MCFVGSPKMFRTNTLLNGLRLKNRLLKSFCTVCNQGLKELSALKSILEELLQEVDNLNLNLDKN